MFLLYGPVVQTKEIGFGTRRPVGVRQMEKLIEVNRWQLALARNGLGQRGLAAIAGAQNADARAKVFKTIHR